MASLLFLEFINGKKPGNSFLCIEVYKSDERPVALQTHMSPKDMPLAFAAEDFTAPFAPVCPGLKTFVSYEKEDRHEYCNDRDEQGRQNR
jgi:hypothetical protein